MTTLLAILGAALVGIVVIGYLLTVINFVERVASLWRRCILRQPKAEPASKEDIAEFKLAVDKLIRFVDGLPQAKAEVRHHFEEGLRLHDAHQQEAAIAEFERAFAVAENDSQRCALHIFIGNSFAALSQPDEAETHYRQALAVAEKAEDNEGRAAALGYLALAYRERGQPTKAKRHFNKALTVFREIGNPLGEAIATTGVGLAWCDRGALDPAEEELNKALAMFEQLRDPAGQTIVLTALALVHLRRPDLGAAEQQFKKALAIDGEIGNKLGQANALAALGLVAERRGDTKAARPLLQQALSLYQQIGASGEGSEAVRRALERLGTGGPPKRKRPRKKSPPKRP